MRRIMSSKEVQFRGIFPKVFQIYIYATAGVLVVTATAKFMAAMGTAKILASHDPLLGIAFRYLFVAVGAAEMAVAIVCFFGNRVQLQAELIAFLATNFVLYRLALLAIGYHKPCPCLGNITETIHLGPNAADILLKIVLTFLFIGSYSILLWLRQSGHSALDTAAAAD